MEALFSIVLENVGNLLGIPYKHLIKGKHMHLLNKHTHHIILLCGSIPHVNRNPCIGEISIKRM